MTDADAIHPTNIPSAETIELASHVKVLDGKGNQVPFGDLFASSKTIIVFIRHFFCGTCQVWLIARFLESAPNNFPVQAYVSRLAAVPGTKLAESNVQLVIIGCGEWELIDDYKKNTGFTGNIYADPSRELYRKLGMTTENLKITPTGQKKRSYVPETVPSVLKSIWKGPITHPLQLGKQGNISQLGGDFIFGPGNTCHFTHLMEHTEDHIEVVDLMKEAGVKIQ
ncbi:hypothetical protein ACEPAI_30 [Sanghuangporus weigelae]